MSADRPPSKEHIRPVLRDGYWWHSFRCGDRVHLLCRLGRAGDCIRY